jgi:hypothetical protein
MTTKPKKRKPNDATFYNINALKKRLEKLEVTTEFIKEALEGLLEARNKKRIDKKVTEK